jgi:2-polyprenyl-3-methyl-5-hydroxy-6-metoxy-1,4-benzoquinol methylase
MDYRDQENFLCGSRIWGGLVCAAFLVSAALVRVTANGRWRAVESIVFAAVAVAVAVLIYYTPDYLHLSVTPDRRQRWEIKLRWRIIAAILVLGLLCSPGSSGRPFTFFAVAVLAGINWLAKSKISRQRLPALFLATDLLLIFLALIRANAGVAGTMLLLLAAAAHLAIVRSDDQRSRRAIITFVAGLIIAAFAMSPYSRVSLLSGILLFLIAAGGTFWLVNRAQRQNAKNVAAAIAELIEFTGYPAGRIRELWATSNQQLAANWQSAKPQEDNPEEMAEWYRQNSELYMFAISAYNLEYKRIRSNMKVLRWARGATLDYGAGNGEILLELARRGQPAAYYDVEGMTMRFARHRAARAGLKIDFYTTKDALAQAARQRGFDTVFSFDVLEHLPDLPGELSFLSSLLASGGLFVFDVPAGSTRAHPMHLNHDLNVLAYMNSRGLKDERDLLLRLPFRKEEKFIFRAAGGNITNAA